MERVDVADLKAHLDDYLERLRRGEAFEVCDGGETIGALEPCGVEKLAIVKPASRPASELWTIRAPEPMAILDAVELLRWDRDNR